MHAMVGCWWCDPSDVSPAALPSLRQVRFAPESIKAPATTASSSTCSPRPICPTSATGQSLGPSLLGNPPCDPTHQHLKRGGPRMPPCLDGRHLLYGKDAIAFISRLSSFCPVQPYASNRLEPSPRLALVQTAAVIEQLRRATSCT